jgi:murein DD-endopeptidase MepM/ murein hydrolase activator NlpD
MQVYTVTEGDTLGEIARKVYGDAGQWRRIWEANKDQIPDPNLIRPGQQLVIPGDSGGSPSDSYAFPVQGYRGTVELHWGSHSGASDLFALEGTAVVAMCGGLVTYVGTEWTDIYGGNNVAIRGDDGLEYYYAHGDRAPLVVVGAAIPVGQFLFGVGDTGNARGTGHHLHIGIGYGIQHGTGPGGGAGINFNAVELMRRVLSGSAGRTRPGRSGQYRVVNTGHFGLSVQTRPSHSAPAAGGFLDGTVIEAEDNLVQAEGRAWRRVLRPVEGWCADEFLAAVLGHVEPAPEGSRRVYTVKAGDTLGSIAREVYGDAGQWRRIWEANRDQIPDPNLIHPGQQLVIPAADEQPVPLGGHTASGVLTVAQLYELVRRRGAIAGVDRIMVAAALTESNGNTEAIGDSGHSAGLWQLHDQGLGAGMSVAERCDPDTACARMLPQFHYWYNHWAAEGLFGENLAAHTYLWTERPRDYNVPGSAPDVHFRARWREVGG